MPQIKNKDAVQIIAAGGVVFRITDSSESPEVLLIHRLGVWDLPKGKLEDKESIAMCAVREVAEECGTELPMLISNLGQTYHEYIEKNILIGKTTYWYSMVFPKGKTKEDFSPQIKEGIEKISWLYLEEAKNKVGFENLREVVNNFEFWFRSLK